MNEFKSKNENKREKVMFPFSETLKRIFFTAFCLTNIERQIIKKRSFQYFLKMLYLNGSVNISNRQYQRIVIKYLQISDIKYEIRDIKEISSSNLMVKGVLKRNKNNIHFVAKNIKNGRINRKSFQLAYKYDEEFHNKYPENILDLIFEENLVKSDITTRQIEKIFGENWFPEYKSGYSIFHCLCIPKIEREIKIISTLDSLEYDMDTLELFLDDQSKDEIENLIYKKEKMKC